MQSNRRPKAAEDCRTPSPSDIRALPFTSRKRLGVRQSSGAFLFIPLFVYPSRDPRVGSGIPAKLAFNCAFHSIAVQFTAILRHKLIPVPLANDSERDFACRKFAIFDIDLTIARFDFASDLLAFELQRGGVVGSEIPETGFPFPLAIWRIRQAPCFPSVASHLACPIRFDRPLDAIATNFPFVARSYSSP